MERKLPSFPEIQDPRRDSIFPFLTPKLQQKAIARAYGLTISEDDKILMWQYAFRTPETNIHVCYRPNNYEKLLVEVDFENEVISHTHAPTAEMMLEFYWVVQTLYPSYPHMQDFTKDTIELVTFAIRDLEHAGKLSEAKSLHEELNQTVINNPPV